MRHITLKRSTYLDSVSLMRISKKAGAVDGVSYAMVAMATDTNLDLLREAGFDPGETEGAAANDLLIAVDVETDSALGQVIDVIEREIQGGPAPSGTGTLKEVAGLDATLGANPDINLVLISVPGRYAVYEARKALEAGRHVMIFSDNVRLEDEVRLKTLAAERGLLVMGPDCGTAIINGVGLGFANEVPRGDIGMVAASGTGAQEVSSILARCYGMGISQLIGTGGRDVSRDVGGVMLKMGLKALIDDAATRAIVVVSKRPDPETADEIIEVARQGKKPCIIHFTGQAETRSDAGLTFTGTLAQTAFEAARAAGKQVKPARPFDGDAMTAVLAAAKRLSGKRKHIRGIFSGGTLAQETLFLLSGKFKPIHTNLKIDGFPRLDDPGAGSGHTIVDLGDDAFTRGRAHPMIDQSYRLVRLAREMEDAETAIILLDVVLGYGCHEAPGVEIAEAITSAWGRVKQGGDRPLVIAGICGTHGDPQGYAAQRDALEDAGVYVAEHNEGMCELALAALGGRRNG